MFKQIVVLCSSLETVYRYRRSEGGVAVNRWAQAATGAAFSSDELRKNLDVPELPDLDLMVRTGGEMRLSNFLLW